MAIAVCAIKRPVGCAPPRGASNRTSAGTGPDGEVAAFRAMCEAAERYALQFHDGREGNLQPVAVAGGDPVGRPVEALCLGHPDHQADSKGCAAGDTIADAIDRAAFEALENYVMPDISAPPVEAVSVDAMALPDIAPMVAFLDARLRTTRLRIIASPPGYCVCHIVLSDPDGGRPTFGRAAGADIGKVAEKALHEAVLSWRNMVELERNAVALPEDDVLIAHYRGCRKAADIPRSAIYGPIPEVPSMKTSPLHMLAEVTGRRVQAFDMSVADIAMPVVRVVIDPPD